MKKAVAAARVKAKKSAKASDRNAAKRAAVAAAKSAEKVRGLRVKLVEAKARHIAASRCGVAQTWAKPSRRSAQGECGADAAEAARAAAARRVRPPRPVCQVNARLVR